MKRRYENTWLHERTDRDFFFMFLSSILGKENKRGCEDINHLPRAGNHI